MHSISSKEISFVSYGNTSKGASTIYNPFKVNGEEILELIHRKQYNEWITSMKWGIVISMDEFLKACTIKVANEKINCLDCKMKSLTKTEKQVP
ncbi:Uncharacterized protein APZ42_012297 [Daphnia magna]|uniref:Uncharacterized protein n=1 Tax=Daphnia magna TaxID=35525 RepID=A0A162RZT9_9CRUS|nr:Uncharacterized protein APZ42_012297 [Daphnia magna]